MRYHRSSHGAAQDVQRLQITKYIPTVFRLNVCTHMTRYNRLTERHSPNRLFFFFSYSLLLCNHILMKCFRARRIRPAEGGKKGCTMSWVIEHHYYRIICARVPTDFYRPYTPHTLHYPSLIQRRVVFTSEINIPTLACTHNLCECDTNTIFFVLFYSSCVYVCVCVCV